MSAVMTTPMTVQEVEAGAKSLRHIMMANTAPKMVLATDVRRLGAMDQPVQEAIMKMMQSDNPRLEFSGLWGDKHNKHSLLTFRLIREAGNPNRQVFLSHMELFTWLAPHLAELERKALQKWFEKRLRAPGPMV